MAYWLKHYLYETLIGVGVTGAVVELPARQPRNGEVLIYERAVIENETSNGTVVRGLVRRPDSDVLVLFFAAFNQDVPQIYDNRGVVVGEHERLVFRLSGTTDNDVLRVYLSGFSMLPQELSSP